MNEMKSQLDQELLNSLGLDAHKIAHHQEKIYQVLRGELSTSLPIIDVCSIENNGVLPWNTVNFLIKNITSYAIFHSNIQSSRRDWIHNFIITCIPAAGAAARYRKDIPIDYLAAYPPELPKALLPATIEGDTFLDIKLMEQNTLIPTSANALIVPIGFREQFENLAPGWFVVEQDQNLSTIRFHLDGTPYHTDDNAYSPVPAGHGELLHLFDDIVSQFPNSCAIHLRNIDNIIGTQPERVQELSLLAEMFYLIRCALDIVRAQITKFMNNPDLALDVQSTLYNSSLDFLRDCCPDLMPNIKCVSKKDYETCLNLLNRPLSVFGVVQKENGDSGGGPVFVKMPKDKVIKICLEMSHANDDDRKEYFGENGKSPYFNPVLVFLETQTEAGLKTDFNSLFDENFWLLSKRNYKNLPVCYYETVLYELIGNSEKTNLVFIEVPRTLFKPHKYFLDSVGKTREAYGL